MQSRTKKRWVTAVAIPVLGAGLALTACGDDGDDDGTGGGGGSGGSGGTPSGGTGGTAGNFGIQHAQQNTAPSAVGGTAAR